MTSTKLIIALVLLLVFAVTVCAETDNFSITFRFENFSSFNGSVTENLFEITNLDYYKTKNSYNLTFNYSIFVYDSLEIALEKTESFKLKNFKYKKSTGLGKFIFLNNTQYLVCAKLDMLAQICKNFSNGKIIPAKKKNLCSMTPEIIIDDYFAVMDADKISFKLVPTISSTSNSSEKESYLIEYWIEDLFGNILKKKMNTSSTTKKSFSIKDGAMMTILVKARIYNISCRRTNNDTERSVAIVVNPEVIKKEPVEILETKQIGSVVFAKIAVFRNSSENTLNAWVEQKGKKISNTFTMEIFTQLSDVIFSIPLPVSDSVSGGAILVAEGVGGKTSSILDIRGNPVIARNSNVTNSTIPEITPGKHNESKQEMKLEKDFFLSFIDANKTENVINSPNVNTPCG